MKKAGPTECSYVIGHGQLLIKQNAQVVDLACRLYGGVRQDQRFFRDFIQLLTCSQPDNLRLVFVKLQTIIGHPVADQSDTFAEASHRMRVITGRRADVNLCVVGVRMGYKPIRKEHVEQFGCVQQKKNRA